MKTASCACRTTLHRDQPRATVLHNVPQHSTTLYNATTATTDRLSLSCQPEWLVIGYGGLWWIMVEVSTPWYRLIVIHGDLTVNVVFLQLLWGYNSVVFTHLTFYSTEMTFLWWYCPNASGCDFCRRVKKFNFLLHRNDFLSMVRSYCIRMWFYIKSCLV